MSKSDGKKIVIQFDDSILSGIEGSESSFEVLVPEYEYVPDGPMTTKSKTVDSVEADPIKTRYTVNFENCELIGVTILDGEIILERI